MGSGSRGLGDLVLAMLALGPLQVSLGHLLGHLGLIDALNPAHHIRICAIVVLLIHISNEGQV
jgi:hypothetical protein